MRIQAPAVLVRWSWHAAAALIVASSVGSACGAEPYRQPPREIVDILAAPAPPIVIPAPTGDALLLEDIEAYPPIELLARPFLKLAGVRVDPALNARRRDFRAVGLTLQRSSGGSPQAVKLPAGSYIGTPVWSFDGKQFAFTRTLDDGVELWVGNARAATAHVIPGVRLTDVLGAPIQWTRDNRQLLVRTVPANRGAAPAVSRVPSGPAVQQTAGKRSRMATFRDLLEDPQDEAMFDYYGASQLALIDTESGKTQAIATPGLYADATFAPNGGYLLVTRIVRPFSYRVPVENFGREIEIWERSGKRVAVVAKLPVADEVPQQGVATGPRDIEWQPFCPATLVWAEALDGGDPMKKVPHRDRILRVAVAKALGNTKAKPADSDRLEDIPNNLALAAEEVLQLQERLADFTWTGRRDRVFISEYNRDRRWLTTWSADFAIQGGALRKIFDRSINDAYKDPGNPVLDTRADGTQAMRQDGDFVYLAGRGSSPNGDRPFLDRLDLRSLATTRLFESPQSSLETFVAFASGTRILVTAQSPTDPPNQFAVDLVSHRRTKLTDYHDPAPQVAGIEKRLLKYHRADGTPLTAFLYLPPGYKQGTRLPVMLWAYPREFSDASTAGQVRGSENTFVRLTGASQLFFLTQGYAVLDDPTMPVIGDPEHMNDTYVPQIVAAAKAAVDTLVAMGVADRERIGIGGHSYGAFMTANLLAHSDLFAAGIARSGAYNRSLTPFGFQDERRSYWDATDTYTQMSPFTFANQMHAPILLIHGEEDTNSGTFPIQSERFFQALQGNGATARLVMLPYEGHGYRARESIFQTLAEMVDWADRWVKNRPARSVQESSR